MDICARLRSSVTQRSTQIERSMNIITNKLNQTKLRAKFTKEKREKEPVSVQEMSSISRYEK